MNKNDIRAVIKNIRIDGAQRASFSYAACQNALTVLERMQAQTILAYAAMKDELDAGAFIEAARVMGKRVAFPVCMEECSMQAYIPLSPDAWAFDRYGIQTPVIEKSEFIPAREIDLILTPGMAFDERGARLGRGAGYYDRFFARTDAFRLGICKEAHILSHIPMEAHDVFMHAVATDRRMIWIGLDI